VYNISKTKHCSSLFIEKNSTPSKQKSKKKRIKNNSNEKIVFPQKI